MAKTQIDLYICLGYLALRLGKTAIQKSSIPIFHCPALLIPSRSMLGTALLIEFGTQD